MSLLPFRDNRRWLWALLLGASLALALPPVYFLPAIIPALLGLFHLATTASTLRRALWEGWLWGLGFFAAGTYWICISLLVDAARFAWLIPFCIIGLSGYFAVYIALAAAVTWRFRASPYAYLIFAVCWALAEMARGYVFTGFPWNVLAIVWGFSDIMIQPAALFGAYGLSFITVFLVAGLALFFPGLPRRRALRVNFLHLALMMILAGWGVHRLHSTEIQTVPGVKVRLVQASVEQSLKWDPRAKGEGIARHLQLTKSPGLQDITHVIWPETALPTMVAPNMPLLSALGSHLPKNGTLITGALRSEGERTDSTWNIYNSLFTISSMGKILAHYDKHHLVPFGEFVPLRNVLPLDKITPGDTDFSRGPGPQTITIPGFPAFSPLICYEGIFPEEAVDRKNRPALLLNITNDAWFGVSSGPYQHLQLVRLRAVEQGLPLIRAAGNGISAVIDPLGRVTALLRLNEIGVLDSTISQPLASTFFTKFLM